MNQNKMMNDEQNNHLIEFITNLTRATLICGIVAFLLFLIVPDPMTSNIFIGVSMAMFLIFSSLYTFLQSLIPPEIKDDLERQAEEEAERLINRLFPDNKKEEQKENDEDKDK